MDLICLILGFYILDDRRGLCTDIKYVEQGGKAH